LLGLPSDVAACVFNADGVLVGSAAIHAEVWREIFDDVLSRRGKLTDGSFARFDVRIDYPKHVHGRSRLDAVREFLASRGISLPAGSADDLDDAETVHAIANRKKRALLRRLEERDVSAYEGARLYLELAHDANVQCAVVSGSTTMATVLDHAGLTRLIDERIDGNTMVAEHLQGKPAPDMFLAACRHLGVGPQHTAVFETTPDGVRAGRAGGFEIVVAVDREGAGGALRAEGPDLVVADLRDILELALAA
jgi:HAD superfamily hydrolase (TIGR01509 family)